MPIILFFLLVKSNYNEYLYLLTQPCICFKKLALTCH
jgi:hypothetical protein